jgi:hypothetical protein
VPFSHTYQHIRTFTDLNSQEDYFLSKTGHTLNDFTYQRDDQAIKVPIQLDELYHTNYLMFQNSSYGPKWFYAFITKKEYVNPQVTRIFFEIDVYQTWQFNIQWKPCHVIREHRTRWNSNGTPVINTVDEGLDYGTEYETVSVEHIQPYDTVYFLVIVSKGLLHNSPDPSKKDMIAKKVYPMTNAVPQPLSYYVHPFNLNGGTPAIKLGALSRTLTPINEVLKAMASMDSGLNNIVSMYITEYIGLNVNYDLPSDTLTFPAYGVEQIEIADDHNPNTKTLYIESLPSYNGLPKTIKGKYNGFAGVNTGEESKLLMFPYTVTMLTDLKGNVLELKNEYINGNDINITVKGSLGTANKVSYQVTNYLMDQQMSYNSQVSLQNSLICNEPSDVPIITDLLAAYLQGNRNSIQAQKNAIVSNAVFGTVFGAVGGLGRGPVGVAKAGVEGVEEINSAYQQIAMMNAKQKDIAATPPSMQGMGGNTSYSYGNNLHGVYIIKKQITSEYREKLKDFFKMYGYKIGELKTPSLKTRQHFNYIQTIGCFLTGSIPQDAIVQLQNIFDRGVTLWHGDWVGDYSMSNGEV